MRFTKLLAVRLFITVLLVMTVGTAIFTTLNVNWQARQHMERTVRSAFRMSDVIKRSTHYSMRLNRREDIYQIISTIGTEPGIEIIRIYNKRGTITFSTDSTEVGKNVDMTAEACNACHGGGALPTAPNPNELTRIFASAKGYRVLGMITPIRNEASCSEADCHAHPASQTVLGVLDILMPLNDVDALVAQTTQVQYMWGGLLILVVTVTAGIFILLLVNRPVRRLTHGTQEIIKGNLNYRIPVRSHDEIGVLAASFNKMTDELSRAREENQQWTRTLEQRVEEKTEELKRAQRHMIQVEKMVSLGKLAATVAHELNNPLAGVLTYAKLLKKRILPGVIQPEEKKEIDGELTLIADESARCGAIVKNLLLFSKQKVGELMEEDIRIIAERSVKLLDHHLKMHNVALSARFGDTALVLRCDPQQIEQALLALEINAVEAMPDGGTIEIVTARDESSRTVRIGVRDTGIGIAEDDLPHIFEPFFTTKENEKGTGLGLSVVYGIVERHGGAIHIQSKKGSGTRFTLTLPLDYHEPESPANVPITFSTEQTT